MPVQTRDSLPIDETARRRFESAWREGRPEPLEQCLPAVDHPNYLATLEELVKIELEFAWKSRRGGDVTDPTVGQSPLVEGYLPRFPRLNQPAIVLRLLAQEYLVRRRYGDRPALEEYRRRFPQHVVTGREVETLVSSTGLETGGTSPLASAGGDEDLAFLGPSQGADELGRLGPYRVLKVLGKGGMGIVFQAEDAQLRRLVALKVMKPGLAASASARQRFLREAQTTAALEHEHVVSIYQVGEDRGVPFLAMPLLKGEALETRLRRAGKLPLAEVLRIGREMAMGLAAAHDRGLIHRDIKPANVWLESKDEGGTMEDEATQVAGSALSLQPSAFRVKLLDFGLARASRDDTHLTGSGTILGTPAFMAPEQAEGHAVDHRCDLFSLGCVLYRMSTGEAPFKGRSVMATLRALALDTPTAPRQLNPELPPGFSDLVMQLLAKEPAERPASARVVIEAIRATEKEVQHASAEETELRRAPGALPALFDRPLRGRQATLRRHRLAVAVGVLLLAGAGLLVAQVIIRIKAKHGPDTTVGVPAGSSVQIDEDGNVTVAIPDSHKPAARAKRGPVTIRPVPVKFAAGDPLSEAAVVVRPTAIGGVRSWSLETRGHRSLVLSVAYRPSDGRLLASAGHDAIIRLWDPATGRLVRALLGHAAEVLALAWSPDGKYLASAGMDHTVRFWDGASGQVLRVVQLGPRNAVVSLAWSPDGRTLAAGCEDKMVRLWDVESGRLVDHHREHQWQVLAVAWSPDGKTLASASHDATVRLWEVGSGRPPRILRGHTVSVWALAWSPDGSLLASNSYDGTVRLWNTATGQTVHTIPGAGYGGNWFPLPLAWSPDGRTLAVGAGTLWNVGTLDVQANLARHARILSYAWSPDGKTLAAGDWEGAVRLFDSVSGETVRSIGGHPMSCNHAMTSWSPDAGTLATVASDYLRVLLWKAGTGKLLHTLVGHRGVVWRTAWSPDGKMLASASVGDKTVRLWDAQSGKQLLTLGGSNSAVTAVAWSPDSKTVAAGSGESDTVRLWDVKTGHDVKTLAGRGKEILAVAWSPDGKRLVASGRDMRNQVWDVRKAKPLCVLEPWAYVNWLDWSPDGKTIAGACGDATFRLWDADSGKLRHQFVGSGSNFYAAAWSPDSKTSATVFNDGTVRLFDARLGKPLRILRGRTLQSCSLRWSSNGKTVAAGSPFGLSRLWDADTGEPRGCLATLEDQEAIVVSPEGHFRGPPQVEKQLVYVVQTDHGQETFSPQEFTKKYRWRNDPQKVRLIGK
jgi:WD40 repeat protein/serine/threonine protein kinase